MLQLFLKNLIKIFFRLRNWWPFWYYILNFRERNSFRLSNIQISPFQNRMVLQLKRSGIAICTLSELFGEEDLISDLQTYVNNLEPIKNENRKKKFLINLIDPQSPPDFTNPFFRLALSQQVLGIVNSYLGMFSKLKYVTIQATEIVGNAEAIQSQSWHRDPQEKRMCKVFIYLSDVDLESGPFEYIKNSVFGDKWGTIARQNSPEGSYPESVTIEKIISHSEVSSIVGKAGTVVFCDTTGLHKGGHSRKKSRLMSTFFFSAPSYIGERYLKDVDLFFCEKNNLDTPAMKAINASFADRLLEEAVYYYFEK